MKVGDIMMIKQIINGENISIALFFIGLYGLCARRNIIKTIISIAIMQAALILFFLSINAPQYTVPPIGKTLSSQMGASDPLPQALMITAVVVGISVTATSLTMFVSLYHKYGSTNWNRVKRKRGELD